MNIKGSFEVQMRAEPPFDIVDGVALARATFDKQFSGPLTAISKVEMLSVRSAVGDSGAYVAVERITGTVEGKRGTFALVHRGMSDRGARSLAVDIVPDSGTGELEGITGRMNIEIVEGKHFYDLELALKTSEA